MREITEHEYEMYVDGRKSMQRDVLNELQDIYNRVSIGHHVCKKRMIKFAMVLVKNIDLHDCKDIYKEEEL